MKRLFDLIVAFFSIVFLSPIFIIIAYKLIKHLGSPILFRQTRPGLNGEPFEMIKFRTMKDATDKNGNTLPDSERMTPFGQKLRNMSLDELPELWNVFKGDMSLVGPRPLLMQYLPLYSKEQARRHNVRPGITGWAQVNGRNAISWEEKFELDVWYVDNHSLWLDIKILFLTIKKVIAKDGISAQDHVTAAPFEGTNNDENRK
ncbi:sugar transferase [Salinivibrio proteolyticus]|uniref:sugar transferase n=1 Tax=Salinivibrio proteolyticus TaxID=334715 RepID=UPI0009892613|nr:sugar transferase [Salinivibrio proteolyticus]OOF21183.1 sugar transferase [Salinivibrio proteolyticus]